MLEKIYQINKMIYNNKKKFRHHPIFRIEEKEGKIIVTILCYLDKDEFIEIQKIIEKFYAKRNIIMIEYNISRWTRQIKDKRTVII